MIAVTPGTGTSSTNGPPPLATRPPLIKIALTTNRLVTEGQRWFCALLSGDAVLGDTMELLTCKAPVGTMARDDSADPITLPSDIDYLDLKTVKHLYTLDLPLIFHNFPQTIRLDLEGCPHLCADERFKDFSFSLLPKLEVLSLSDIPNLTDEHLIGLKNLRHLKQLDLSKTEITDTGLTYLEGLPLDTLDIRHCIHITDVGIRALSSLTYLTALYVEGCRPIDPIGRKGLERSLGRELYWG